MRTLDIETNMRHDIVWCAVTEDHDTGVIYVYAQWDLYPGVKEQVAAHAPDWVLLYNTDYDDTDVTVGHNAIGFDFPVLARVWGVDTVMHNMIDTWIMSSMYNCNIEGGHSLKAWGQRLDGDGKIEYEDHDAPLDLEKIIYCVQDVKLTTRLYRHLSEQMEKLGFNLDCLDMEMEVAYWTKRQQENGFYFDIDACQRLYAKLIRRQGQIDDELQETFPPITHQRVSEKTGKPLKDRIEVFNPGSRMQIARRLEGLGVKWTKFTEKGNVIVDEKTLKEWSDIPEAALVLEYLTLGKKASMAKSWLDHYNPTTHCIHGRVNTCGAVTRRMTHSAPNVAQADGDHAFRDCWTSRAIDRVIVGADASGLELRCFAHYLQDPEYTDLILHGDIHWHNAVSAGLAEDVPYDENDRRLWEQRQQAKTFIYAMLYGAGLAKIGEIVGGGVAAGRELKENFLNAVPAYADLCDKVERIAACGTVPGIDGSRIRVRHTHAALNTLLQSCGAIIMKKALTIAMPEIERYDALLVAQVHDEFQTDTPKKHANVVGEILVHSLEEAGESLRLRCPITGEYKVGDSWAETH